LDQDQLETNKKCEQVFRFQPTNQERYQKNYLGGSFSICLVKAENTTTNLKVSTAKLKFEGPCPFSLPPDDEVNLILKRQRLRSGLHFGVYSPA